MLTFGKLAQESFQPAARAEEPPRFCDGGRQEAVTGEELAPRGMLARAYFYYFFVLL